MDIRNLGTFVRVAEMNSFTKAAAALGYSQSTVSFQIKQLEDEFDCQLFERINHSISLTQKGRKLLDYAQQIHKLTNEINENMMHENRIEGQVHFATANSLCVPLMKDKLLDFQKNYPGITIKMTVAGTEEMIRMVNCNEVDAILTLDSHIYNTEYVIDKEEKVEVYFVAGPGLVENADQELTIKEIMNYPFLLTEKGMSYRRILDEKMAAVSLEVTPVLETENTDLLADMAEQGVGISLLPDYIVKDRIECGKLVRLKVKDVEIEIWKQLLYHRKKWVSKPLECFIHHFCDF